MDWPSNHGYDKDSFGNLACVSSSETATKVKPFVYQFAYKKMGNDLCKAPVEKTQGEMSMEALKRKEEEDAAIKIQSRFRGHHARRGYTGSVNGTLISKQSQYYKATTGHEPPQNDAILITTLPNYDNEQTIATKKKLEPFRFDIRDDPDSSSAALGPYEYLDNGAVYIGQYKRGRRHGKGKQFWTDGSFYEGTWKNGAMEGKGRYIYPDGAYYEGEFKNGVASGRGKFVHSDGVEYVGEMLENKQHGVGEEKWPENAFYKGSYVNGKKEGRGTFRWADQSSYEGDFVNNNFHGKGTFIWADKRKYEGQWQNNKMHGYGIFMWPDGRKYEGEYLQDNKHGKGVLTWPNGRKYDGEWRNGVQEGKGILYEPNGDKVEGMWKNGKCHDGKIITLPPPSNNSPAHTVPSKNGKRK